MGPIYIDGIVFGIQNGGGISVYFSEFARFLMSANADFKLESPPNENSFFSKLPASDNVRVTKSRMPIIIERLRNVRVSNEFFVFHSSYYRRPSLSFTGKQVVTVHDFVAERIYGRRIRTKVFAEQKRRAMLAADHIVAISEFTRNEMLSLYPELSAKEITVVPNGVGRAFKLSRIEPTEDPKSLVYVGSRAPYKNFPAVVSALGSELDKDLIIVGGGRLSEAELSLLSARLGERYQHIPFLSDSELAALYSKAFALIYPSDMEGFGIPPIEAMSVGCPVIVKDIPVTREVCGCAAYFIEQVNDRSISTAIKDISSAQVRENLIAAGHKRAQRYDWNLTFARIQDIYESLDA